MARIVVLGIGNILLSDEGFGVHVIRKLMEHYDTPPDVEVIDGGTSGMDLLDRVAGADALLIVDCAAIDAVPGSVREYTGDAVPAFFQTRISPHQIGLSDLLGAVALLGEMPSHLTLIAAVPQSLELGLEMTECCEKAAGKALEILIARLTELGAAPVRRIKLAG